MLHGNHSESSEYDRGRWRAEMSSACLLPEKSKLSVEKGGLLPDESRGQKGARQRGQLGVAGLGGHKH